nr:uridine diphosphate-glycosyltransferases 340G1 [Glyphodes pyloalis]
MVRLFVYFSLISVIAVDAARILGLFPVPSISHQIVFRGLTSELAKRGHELVILTPNPALPKERPPDNVTEIDVSFGYERLRSLVLDNRKVFKRGVLVGADAQLDPESYRFMLTLIIDMMECPELKEAIKGKQFDLIIAEAFMNYQLIFSKVLNAPLILFSSFHGFPESYDAIGATARHPIYYPTMLGDKFGGESLIDKFKQAKFEFDYYRSMKTLESFEDEYLKQNYGPDTPTVRELVNNVDMLFINSHPVFCDNRPLPPNAVYVGPLHLKPLKEIPQDLKTILDNSKTGVIYVSLGTNVNTSDMDKDLFDAFLEAFRELPYDILWKLNDDKIENLPKNVIVRKWFPQRDLLVHPNIKLFVTQGGLQSTDEAIDAEVPLVGIPMLGDQFYNVHKYVQLGIGVKVDALTLDKGSLLRGIQAVLNDESYKNNVKKLKQIMNDQPESSLERAVWWTEYVIRHGGAKHLRASAANISWSEYWMVDVIAAVLGVAVILLIAVFAAIKFLLTRLRQPKVKKS